MEHIDFARRLAVLTGTLTLTTLLLGILFFPSQQLDRWLLDELFLLRSNPPTAHDSLVVVALDQKYGEQFNFPDVTPPAYLAEVVRVSKKYGAKVIALDIVLSDGASTAGEWDSLIAAIKAKGDASSVVLPSILDAYGLRYRDDPRLEYELVLEPPDTLLSLTRSGYITFFGGKRPEMKVLTELTRLTRRFASKSDTLSVLPSFALQTVATFRGRVIHTQANRLYGTLAESLGYPGTKPAESDAAKADALRRPHHINYRGPVEPGSGFKYVSSEDLLAAERLGFRDSLAFRLEGKLVLIGATHRRSEDVHETPWGAMYGVEVHANIINSLLTRQYLHSWNTSVAAWLLGGIALAWVVLSFWSSRYAPFFRLSVISAILWLASFPVLLCGWAFLLFNQPQGVFVALGWPFKIWLAASILGFVWLISRGDSRPLEENEAV